MSMLGTKPSNFIPAPPLWKQVYCNEEGNTMTKRLVCCSKAFALTLDTKLFMQHYLTHQSAYARALAAGWTVGELALFIARAPTGTTTIAPRPVPPPQAVSATIAPRRAAPPARPAPLPLPQPSPAPSAAQTTPPHPAPAPASPARPVVANCAVYLEVGLPEMHIVSC